MEASDALEVAPSAPAPPSESSLSLKGTPKTKNPPKEQCSCLGPRASTVNLVDPKDEEVIKQVERLDKLINAAASAASGNPHHMLPLTVLTRRNSTMSFVDRASSTNFLIDGMLPMGSRANSSKFSVATGDLGQSEPVDHAALASDITRALGSNGSASIGRSRKVFPRKESGGVENNGSYRDHKREARDDPHQLDAESLAWKSRRSSTEHRRSSLASIKDDVTRIAHSVSRMFDKTATVHVNNSIDERRQAKVAELVNREVMVLNANQLARMQQRNAHPFTISIHSTFRHWWDFIMTVSIAYVMVTTPIKAGFNIESEGLGFIIDVMIDMIYLVEIVLNFFTSFESETTGEEIKDLVKIRQNYIKTWFLMDAVSSFPSSLVVATNSLLTLTKILKVARVAKISDSGLIRTITGRIDRTMNPSLMRILKLTFIFFITQHFIACAYYYIGLNYSTDTNWGPSREVRSSSLTNQYIDALYFAIMVTTANDVNPTTSTEKMFVSAMLFIGIVINASIIGSAANLLANLDKEAIARKNQLDSINDYLRFKKVPLKLQNKIRRYYEYALNSRMQDPTEKMFADLPDRLKLQLRLNLHAEFIRKVPLFKVCSHAGIIAIVQCLIQVVAMPGDIIIAQDEMANEFYFIKSGQVSLCVRALTEIVPMGNLGEGSFFGETSLLSGEPATAEVKAERVCELAYLTRDNFAAIIDKFPTFYLAVKRISESRLQTAQNVQKMSKLNRRQTQTLAPKKLSFRAAALIALKQTRHAKRLSAFGNRFSDRTSSTPIRRPISSRWSTGRRMSLPAFNMQYVEKLSMAQARDLTHIKSVRDVPGSTEDELPYD